MSTKEGTDIVRRAKTNNISVTTETCPHYLLLKKKHLEQLGPYGKVTPPIRGTVDDINALWQGLLDGTIDFIASDHAPHPRDEKEPGWENIFAADGGVIGVQTMLPLMLTQVNKGRISLTELVNLTSMNPAKVFNLYPRKGIIQIGSDADLNVIDLKKEFVIRAEDQYSNIDYTPYEGWKVKGIPILTIVRGKIVVYEGEVLAKQGCGEWVIPSGRISASTGFTTETREAGKRKEIKE